MSKLPPWTDNDAAMLRWLDHELDDLIREEDGARARARRALPLSPEEKQALFPEDSDEGAIAAAERGDIGPLRRRHPELARFLHLPALRRGQHYPRTCGNHIMNGWRLLFWRCAASAQFGKNILSKRIAAHAGARNRLSGLRVSGGVAQRMK